MSAQDKEKLNGIELNAEVNQFAFSNITIGDATISADEKTDTFTLIAGNNVSISPGNETKSITISATDTTYPEASSSQAGLMSKTDKAKLDGITSGANKYTLPKATASTLGGVKIGSNISVSSGVISVNKNNILTALEVTSGTTTKYLKEDGTWATPPDTDTNTTYTFTSGDSSGTIKVTPSGGSAQNVQVAGLKSAAYTSSSEYTSAAHATNTTIHITSAERTKWNAADAAVSGLKSAAYTDSSAYAAASHGTHVTAATVKTALGATSTSSAKYFREDGNWATPPNTTYTFDTGTSNGTIKVTPSGGTATNVKVKGLGTAAYENSTDFASASHTHANLTVGEKTYDGSSPISIEASDLGLSSALKFIGTTTTEIKDGNTTNPIKIDNADVTVTNGNVVFYGNKEFVWNGSSWEELGNEGNYKVVQTAVNSNNTAVTTSSSSLAFISKITQNTNGVITVERKNVQTASSAQSGVMTSEMVTNLDNVTATDKDNKAKKVWAANSSGTPGWQDDATLSGALSGDTFKITLDPAAGSKTTATVPSRVAATSTTSGKAGLVPATSYADRFKVLRGSGWNDIIYSESKSSSASLVTTWIDTSGTGTGDAHVLYNTPEGIRVNTSATPRFITNFTAVDKDVQFWMGAGDSVAGSGANPSWGLYAKTGSNGKYLISTNYNGEVLVNSGKYLMEPLTGTSNTASGTGHLVPRPAKGSQSKFLQADGTWQYPRTVLQTRSQVSSWRPLLLHYTATTSGTDPQEVTGQTYYNEGIAVNTSNRQIALISTADAGVPRVLITKPDRGMFVGIGSGKNVGLYDIDKGEYIVHSDDKNYYLAGHKVPTTSPFLPTIPSSNANGLTLITNTSGKPAWSKQAIIPAPAASASSLQLTVNASGTIGWTPIADTWHANTANADGYVSAGSAYPNKVWKTNANGSPGWRDDVSSVTIKNTTTESWRPILLHPTTFNLADTVNSSGTVTALTDKSTTDLNATKLLMVKPKNGLMLSRGLYLTCTNYPDVARAGIVRGANGNLWIGAFGSTSSEINRGETLIGTGWDGTSERGNDSIKIVVPTKTGTSYTAYKALHAGNYGDYCVKLTGGTMTGQLQMKSCSVPLLIRMPDDYSKGTIPSSIAERVISFTDVNGTSIAANRTAMIYHYVNTSGTAGLSFRAYNASQNTSSEYAGISVTYSSAGERKVSVNSGTKIYGAVWNDYAEFRKQEEKIEPGYCVTSKDNGKVVKTTEKFQHCEGVVSDTFGFSIGETDECETPLAVAGRVLVYCDGNKSTYHAGDVVCAGPGGKAYKMTDEEICRYPHRIIGTVSEIPDYETWGDGNVQVNGRIWINVK